MEWVGIHYAYWNEETAESVVCHSGLDKAAGWGKEAYYYFQLPDTLGDTSLIFYLEELEWYEKFRMNVEKPKNRSGEQYRLWKDYANGVHLMLPEIKEQMENWLHEIQVYNCSYSGGFAGNQLEWEEMKEVCPNIGLQDADDFILFWYVHGSFPKGMEPYYVDIVRHRLEEQLKELRLNEPDTSRKRAHELWEYRCGLKEQQLQEILQEKGESDC